MVIIQIAEVWDDTPAWWKHIITELYNKYSKEEWNKCAHKEITKFFVLQGARYIRPAGARLEFDSDEDAIIFRLRYGL